MGDALRESECRYSNLFQIAPVSIWEQDLSELKAAIDDLRSQGVTDFRKYLNEYPEFAHKVAQMIEVPDVNDATLKMYGAKSKDKLLGSLDRLLPTEMGKPFRGEIIAIAEEKPQFETETVNGTLSLQALFWGS